MQVKKFEAPTIQEALDNIKRELGPEAIILQTKKYKRGFGLMSRASVEITAAVSERSLQKKTFTEQRLPEPSKTAVQSLPAAKQASIYEKYVENHLARSASQTQDRVEMSGKSAQKAGVAASKVRTTRYIDIEDEGPVAAELPRGRVAAQAPAVTAEARLQARPQALPVEEEVKQLKRMLAEMKVAQEENLFGSGAQALMPAPSLMNPTLQDAFEQLVVNGIDKRYSLGLIKKVGFELGPEKSKDPDSVLDQLAGEIMKTSEVLSPLEGIRPGMTSETAKQPVVIALVGPTGVGKTTTVAKMASEALLKRNLRVGLVNLDSYKVAAFDQLATYAKILNVPFRSAASAADLKAVIDDFQSLDLVIIDTTGRSQRDLEALREMEGLLNSVAGIQIHLVLSATTRDTELYDMANRFSSFRPQGITISKLDEANIYGAVYNVCQKTKLPLLYLTTGQRVPEDIEEASRERIVSLLMDL